jgi:hypothetical protein
VDVAADVRVVGEDGDDDDDVYDLKTGANGGVVKARDGGCGRHEPEIGSALFLDDMVVVGGGLARSLLGRVLFPLLFHDAMSLASKGIVEGKSMPRKGMLANAQTNKRTAAMSAPYRYIRCFWR